jgi:hypothetical protein
MRNGLPTLLSIGAAVRVIAPLWVALDGAVCAHAGCSGSRGGVLFAGARHFLVIFVVAIVFLAVAWMQDRRSVAGWLALGLAAFSMVDVWTSVLGVATAVELKISRFTPLALDVATAAAVVVWLLPIRRLPVRHTLAAVLVAMAISTSPTMWLSTNELIHCRLSCPSLEPIAGAR